MNAKSKALALLLSALWLLVGCVSVDGAPFAELTLPTTSGESAAVMEIPLLPLSDGEPLRASEVFDLVSPAVAYIETPLVSGSGILIENGYLVSNAHVVWPYQAVRVVFPDGTEFADVEVVGWDLVADLALLKLPAASNNGVGVELEANPLTFVDGSALTMGSDIYLIGYPGEVESFPQPTITQGILARVRTWDATGMEVFQVDADVTGGQSGGVMLTERGEVIGITTFQFTDARYAMVPSAAYVVPRLNTLANEPDTGFSERHPLEGENATEHTGQLEDTFDSDVYILNVPPGEDVGVTVEGVGRPQVFVTTVNFGWDFYQSEEIDDNVHSVDFTTEREAGPYVIHIAQQSSFRNQYTLTSSHPLAFYADTDDSIELEMDKVFSGALDIPGDADRFSLTLKQGEKVAVEVDSLVLTPLLSMIYDSPTRLEFVQSFDGGATNVFGENARIVFEAPKDDSYEIVVDSAAGGEVGGYFITVTMADADEEPTEALESRTFTLSGYGRLAQYESRRNGFAIKFPGDWGAPEECPEGVTACFESEAAGLYIIEEDLDRLPIDLPEADQEAYVDLIEEILLSNLQGAEIVTREPLTTPQGIVGTKLVLNAQAGLVMASRFIYVSEENIAINVSYFTTAQAYEIFEEFFDYSYTTFRVWDEDNLEDDPVYHLDEGVRLSGEQEYDAALEALAEAIALDPELVEAYTTRAGIYVTTGEYDLALADMEAAIALEPEEHDYIGQMALIHWQQGDDETALELADQHIKLDPENPEAYNNRSLMRATVGDFDGALADMETLAEVEEVESDDELAPAFLDSRAYIYLKMEAYEEAKSDYDNALAQDFKSPYPLLGAGIAYARLGLMDEAVPLLEYGMELYEDFDLEFPSPQLADLLAMAAEYIEVE